MSNNSNVDKIIALIKARIKAEGEDHSVAACRKAFQTLVEKLPPLPADVKYHNVDADGIPSEWVSVKESREDFVLFYMHGGGYIVGSPTSHRDLISRMAREARMRALVPDFRLAPEHPFPTQIEDCVRAYQWLLKQGYTANHIVFAGESSGGALVISVLLALKEQQIPLPIAAIAISGMLDLEASSNTFKTNLSVDPSVDSERIFRLARLYIGDRDPKMPLASPIYANLTGLPPLLIQVSSVEVLLDDSIRLAQAARDCGGEVELEVWYGLPHAWHIYASILPEGQQAIVRAGKFARKYTPNNAFNSITK